ncbi:oligosaccharide flippase family protein [Sulfurimonas sp. SAG-AH-194-L11]|nr:oligosaccharide flippase family protein [Sulfurimonas sp. SAG-AH-194-L11]MDF1877895.1 oligosaccharide flippase family protein [Sulfurimonas sp. SAG-AH-194-L11]
MLKLLSKNIFIYGGVNALKSLVPLLMLPILTKHLTLADYGVLSIVETSILFITPFVLLNIHAAINIEYFKLEQVELKKYITNAFMLSLIAFLMLIVTASIFGEYFASLLGIESSLVVLMVVFAMLRVVSSVLLGVYQSRQEPIKFALFTLSQTLFDFVLSYVFVVIYKYGYIGRLEGMYSIYGIFSLFGLYILMKMDYLGKITFKYTKDILHFGLPLIPHAVSGTIMAMSDRYFISYFEGNEQVGLYTVAYQISALMLLVSMSVNQAWSPMLFRLLKNKNIVHVKKITLLLFVLFIFTAVSIYFLQNILFSIFVNENFYSAKEYFGWLLLGFVFQSLYFLVTNLLFFEKKTKFLATLTITAALINIMLNYLLIQEFGTIGVAYATAITWFLFLVVVFLLTIKIIKVKYANN